MAAVVVNYNYERFVADAVQSLLDQTSAFDEVFVVDDGSDDGSRKILREFGAQITLIEKSNGGQLSAAWAALARTNCDYFYVLDADDIALPHLLETLRPHFLGEPVKVQFQLRGMDESGKLLDSVFPTFAEGYDQAAMITDNRILGFYICPPTSGNIFRTDYLRGLANLDLDERQAYDATPAQVAPYFGPIVSINQPLVNYRVHSESDSQWGRPTAELLRGEVKRYSRRWDEVNTVLRKSGFPAVLVDVSAFIFEHDLMIAALEGQRASFQSLRCYVRLIASSGLSRAQRLALSAWATLIFLLPRKLAARLVISRRSAANRSKLVRGIVRVIRSRKRS